MRLLTCCLLVGVGPLTTPWAVSQEPKKSDQDRLQGTWIADAAEVDGKVVKGETTLVFDGKQLKLLSGGKEVYQGTFTVDEAKKPKWIDAKVAVTKGVDRPDIKITAELIGIYDLDGDTLKVCWGSSPRATEFASKVPHHTFATYKRKPK
jgi:uncharacterized protein (TIGR03067 family)